MAINKLRTAFVFQLLAAPDSEAEANFAAEEELPAVTVATVDESPVLVDDSDVDSLIDMELLLIDSMMDENTEFMSL